MPRAVNGGGSPLVLNVKGKPIRLTAPEVHFDLLNTGSSQLTGWTQPASDTAFLVLDRNGNGSIDNGNELFGDHTILPDGTSAPNGYLALSWFDRLENGGNGDGRIDALDVVCSSLRLWFDDNHDGFSQTAEVKTLAEVDVQSISLIYADDRRVDSFGNMFRYRGSAVVLKANGRPKDVRTYDVFFKLE